MTTPISEKDLVIPAVCLIATAPNGRMTSTELIAGLTKAFNPDGDSVAVLAGRKDTKFSQLVRNLKSHGTLVSKGLAYYAGKNKQYYRLTNQGKAVYALMAGNVSAPTMHAVARVAM